MSQTNIEARSKAINEPVQVEGALDDDLQERLEREKQKGDARQIIGDLLLKVDRKTLF